MGRGAEIVGRVFGRRVILASVDRNVHDGVLQAAHAGPVQARPELEAEHIAARRPLGLERSLRLGRHRKVPLATKVERLERDRDGFAMLLSEAEPQTAEGIGRHRLSVAGRRG